VRAVDQIVKMLPGQLKLVILNGAKNLQSLNLLRFFASCPPLLLSGLSFKLKPVLRLPVLLKLKPVLLTIVTTAILNNITIAQNINFSDTVNISEVIVTANRSSRFVEDVPGRVTIIDSKTIDNLPVQNVDEILRNVANVNVNRSWGIFSKNASVTMRGLDGSARVLVLLDGVPLNKSAGGFINWNLVSIDNIDKVEQDFYNTSDASKLPQLKRNFQNDINRGYIPQGKIKFVDTRL